LIVAKLKQLDQDALVIRHYRDGIVDILLDMEVGAYLQTLLIRRVVLEDYPQLKQLFHKGKADALKKSKQAATRSSQLRTSATFALEFAGLAMVATGAYSGGDGLGFLPSLGSMPAATWGLMAATAVAGVIDRLEGEGSAASEMEASDRDVASVADAAPFEEALAVAAAAGYIPVSADVVAAAADDIAAANARIAAAADVIADANAAVAAAADTAAAAAAGDDEEV